MSDRELLELAAKASGMRLAQWEGPESCWQALDVDNDCNEWNPLMYGADCMWLLCKLQLGLEFGNCNCSVMQHGSHTVRLAYCEWNPNTEEYIREDLVRRTIVKAAAQIGKLLTNYGQES